MMQNGYLYEKNLAEHMILQRKRKLKIYGIAKKKSKITLSFQEKTYQARWKQKTWFIETDTLEAGGPYSFCLKKGKKQIQFEDVYVGDVYLLSGQSNMELTIDWVYDTYKEELDKANDPLIRQLNFAPGYAFKEQRRAKGMHWDLAVGDQVRSFSALGYFFAKKRFQKEGIAIGLLQTAVPGAPIEAFLPKEVLEKEMSVLTKITKKDCKNKEKEAAEQKENWYKLLSERDQGIQNNWQSSQPVTTDWKKALIPGVLAKEKTPGVYWLKKSFIVKKEELFERKRLFFGMCIDEDEIWINGIWVGHTDYRYPYRKYEIPEGCLKEGENEITLRLISFDGFYYIWEKKVYGLVGKNDMISLTGNWYMKKGCNMSTPTFLDTNFLYYPTAAYCYMLSPLLFYGYRGILWYQGESNTDQPEGYRNKMESLILSIRKKLGEQKLPFYYVQIAEFRDPYTGSKQEKWEMLRKEQSAAQDIPDTKMVISLPYGDEWDLHPSQKKPIGEMLERISRKNQYV